MTATRFSDVGHVVLLSGGVGGAKLADGLSRCLEPSQLTVVVNTADDFRHYGLWISPDVDTVLYRLSGRVDPQTGWGLDGDTSIVMDAVRHLGEEAWFRLGDRDLAMHLVRTAWLSDGVRLTEVTRRLAERLNVPVTVLPMSDDRVQTRVRTSHGEVHFQTWFVRRRCDPPAVSVRYDGITSAAPTTDVMAAVRAANVVVVGPSNPYLSIGPILALPDVRASLQDTKAPVVAVSPIVGGAALKGPAAAMLETMSGEASPAALVRGYVDFLDGIVIDNVDRLQADTIEDLGVAVFATDTLMRDGVSRERLAREVLAFARRHGPE